MNAIPEPSRRAARSTRPLHLIALANCATDATDDSTEAAWLRAQHDALCAHGRDIASHIEQWRSAPASEDARLVALAQAWRLSDAEVLAVALACAAETEAIVGRVLTWLQAPIGGSRPTIGLIATLATDLGIQSVSSDLASGAAQACGLIQFESAHRSHSEASITVPLPIVFALRDPRAPLVPAGIRIGMQDPPPLSPALQEAARSRARALGANGALVVRSGHPREARAVAAEIAGALRARVAFMEAEPPAGLGPWLMLAGCLPVWCAELAPGERRRLAEIPGWRGPVLVAAGPDGSFERDGEALPTWRVPVPCAQERVALWEAATGDTELAQALGIAHRHAAGRIAELARAGRFHTRLNGSERLTVADISTAARSGTSNELGTLAELLPDPIEDDVLVLPPTTMQELQMLAARCRARDTLSEALGPAARARYRPGVRALLVGPSGTGKSLAVGWLATLLQLPLYRVDLASVTSKYIGETEKNLAQLFARAEHSEVVLLFDEADSLFGKRTDVKEANDRFANAQTNYLLSRIESYEGIAILTSNSRARFDSAFTRRLDAIIEFAVPTPQERRALWRAHLGDSHELDAIVLNRLAASCELAGGHIRNMVFTAAINATRENRGILESDLVMAVVAEYRKLGKPPPTGLTNISMSAQR